MSQANSVATLPSALFVERWSLGASWVYARTLPEYVLALKGLGVERYHSYLADGHSEYFGRGGHRVVSPPVHEVLPVAETGQRETFLQHLRRHERRETTYPEMSAGLAQSGTEKWTVDTGRMTMTFYDKAGSEMLVEQDQVGIGVEDAT